MTVIISSILAHEILATLRMRESGLVWELRRYSYPIPPGCGEYWTRELAEVRSEIEELKKAMEGTK